MMYDKIRALETAMWNAAKNGNKEAFLELVSEDAVMVRGGCRSTGAKYADSIPTFDCKSYGIEYFEIVNRSENSIQVHYVIRREVNSEKNRDQAGLFHVTTTWRNEHGRLLVVFHMDQKIGAR